MAAAEKPTSGGQRGTGNSLLTKKRGLAICAEIAKGTPKRFACTAEGVSLATALEWVRRGEGHDERPATPTTVWFAKEWRKAESSDVIRRRKRLEVSAELDPALAVKVDTWWLERRHPEEFAPQHQRVEITGAGGGPIDIRVAFDTTPIPARTRAELGGPVIDVDDAIELP